MLCWCKSRYRNGSRTDKVSDLPAKECGPKGLGFEYSCFRVSGIEVWEDEGGFIEYYDDYFPEYYAVPPGQVRVGLWHGHPYYQCEHMGDVAVLPNTTWHVVKEFPLTVVPSILNLECKCHGFITDGKWVAA